MTMQMKKQIFFVVREHHLIELERRSTLEVLYLAPIRKIFGTLQYQKSYSKENALIFIRLEIISLSYYYPILSKDIGY